METREPVVNRLLRWIGWGIAVFWVTVAVSCRQARKGELRPSHDHETGATAREQWKEEAAEGASEAEIVARVAELHDSERQWVRQDPQAAEAFRQREETRTRYEEALTAFGPYAAAARERDQAVQRLMEVRAQGDAEAIASAEEAVRQANQKLEETAAWVRLGNPRVQKAYEEWEEARVRYANLKRGQTNLVMKAAAVRSRTAGLDSQNPPVSEGAKEN